VTNPGVDVVRLAQTAAQRYSASQAAMREAAAALVADDAATETDTTAQGGEPIVYPLPPLD
jgi:hypothetical protein